MVGITSGVYSMEGMDRTKIQERALEAVKLHKEHLSLFSIFDNLDQNHAKRLHVTYEAFYHLLGKDTHFYCLKIFKKNTFKKFATFFILQSPKS